MKRKVDFDQINELKTADLFKSNLFKLKIDELLRIRNTKDYMDSLMAFKEKFNIHIVGSYLLGTMLKDGIVDLAIEVPDLAAKDFKENRYFKKRNALLASMIDSLDSCQYSTLQNDPYRPILLAKLSKLKVRIIPVISQDSFAIRRLAPTKDNLGLGKPTPIYNARILHDSLVISHLDLLHCHGQEAPGFRDAIVLLKIWLNQRGLSDSERSGFGFNGYLLSMIILWMQTCKPNKLPKTASSYQILKVFFQFVASYDFGSSVLFLTPNMLPIEDENFSEQAFHDSYPVSIVDISGTVNLAAHVTKAAMLEFQFEAKRSCRLLNDSDDKFEALFVKRVDAALFRFDNIIRIPHLNLSYSDNSNINVALGSISDLLVSALKDRVKLVSVSCPPISPWPINGEFPETCNVRDVTIGILLDPEASLRAVEHGPPGNDQESVDKFRKLWGEKAQLKRFKDGSINESVTFDCDDTLEQRALITCKMAAFLLSRHFSLKTSEMIYWAGLGGRFLKAPGLESFINSFNPVMNAYQTLSKQLRSLRELPLSVSSLIPASDTLYYSSAMIPQPHTFENPLRTPIDVLIQLETSSRWPNDLEAMAMMKTAFYVRIAELIQNEHNLTSTTVYLDPQNKHDSFIDIWVDSKYTFRCRIQNEHEESLLQKAIKKADTSTAIEEAKIAYKKYSMNVIYKSWHSQNLQNACLRHPFLGTTIRLLKRWCSSHFLLATNHSDGLAKEFLELVCAKVYLDSGCWDSPASGFCGFVRALFLLATYDWQVDPLIVQFEPIEKSTMEKIQQNFDNVQRSGSKHFSFFLATAKDPTGMIFAVNPDFFLKVIKYSKAALGQLKNAMQMGVDHDIEVF
jgi:U3 small nucleolar RNA-associated protein 22